MSVYMEATGRGDGVFNHLHPSQIHPHPNIIHINIDTSLINASASLIILRINASASLNYIIRMNRPTSIIMHLFKETYRYGPIESQWW